MPWDLNGNSVGGGGFTEWLGTRDAFPLIIGTQTGGGAQPTAATEALRVTAAAQGRRVGIGTPAPQRRLHVEPSEIHSGGSGAGFSFGNRLVPETGQPAPFTENPANGERWVWYADGLDAALWSGTDMITVARVSGDVVIRQGDLITLSGSVDSAEAVVGDRANFANDVRGGHGEFNSTTVNVTGVTGTSSTYYGVLGTASSRSAVAGTSTNSAGVFGTGDRAWGVFGSSSRGYGVFGQSRVMPDGTGGTGVGVYGYIDGASPQSPFVPPAAVTGFDSTVTDPPNTSPGCGVNGFSRNGVGVRGEGPRWAGLFVGNVRITGTLSMPGKTFQIDHPLDPANRYLNHASVESSERKNVYDGVARLDEEGTAWADLPEWFEALNGDFRYQLTAVGGAEPDLHVAEEVSENRFKIAGGQEGTKVCWQVTGTRKDPWAAANPLEVEQEKPEEERGRYLEPALYDAPEEQRVMIGPIAEAGEAEQRPPEPRRTSTLPAWKKRSCGG
jgi:hypothetical protein